MPILAQPLVYKCVDKSPMNQKRAKPTLFAIIHRQYELLLDIWKQGVAPYEVSGSHQVETVVGVFCLQVAFFIHHQ